MKLDVSAHPPIGPDHPLSSRGKDRCHFPPDRTQDTNLIFRPVTTSAIYSALARFCGSEKRSLSALNKTERLKASTVD
ncbi:Hypothetical protein NTJ_11508 [Nesidiocoris tenuis]|uniref:Uncharacterized protein n=1 Tax=Nesidiocoris tenuis TaxID=355587 RepID=A0ABN7B350_9HEMI|nr:Hypothetical protein NTJ_11508 [Nesidiocoris tenuis]